jgi:2-methylcitrate dehydratase PrpD
MTLSQQFADFVIALRFEDLSAQAVTHAKDLLLDHIGVAAFGATTSWGKAVADTVRRLGGVEESSFYFAGQKTSMPHAAFVNGTFAHAFELDDSFGGVHPGSCVIPAAIAAAERENADGRTLITGIVAGYEILGRLSDAMRHISVKGHHPTGTIGPFGAAVATGKILALNSADMVAALGLAGNFPTGVCEFYLGTMEKRVFAGRAAESGIMATLLAQAGVTGASTIFEGEFGFCRVFSATPKLEKLTEALGTQFYTGRPYVKRYASAGTTHPYIDAAFNLYQRHPQRLADSESIREIRIEGPELILNRRRSETDIKDVMAAQYSIPYVVACTLSGGRPGIREFSAEGIRNHNVQSLLARCKAVPHQEFAGMGKITVSFHAGDEDHIDVENTNLPIAEAQREDITNKFYDLVSALFKKTEKAEPMVRMIENLENLRDVGALTRLMRVESQL